MTDQSQWKATLQQPRPILSRVGGPFPLSVAWFPRRDPDNVLVGLLERGWRKDRWFNSK